MIRVGVAVGAMVMFIFPASARAACLPPPQLAELQSAYSSLSAQPVDGGAALVDMQSLYDNGFVPAHSVIADFTRQPSNIADAKQKISALITFLRQPDSLACNTDAQAAIHSLGSVYAAPAFANLGKPQQDSIFTTIGHAVFDFFTSIFGHIGKAGTAAVVVILLAAIIGAALWLLRGALGGRRVRRSDIEPRETNTDPDVEWTAAERAAADGDYREAVRRAFRGALLAVALRGRMVVDPSWTNRELLARAEADADLLAQLAPAAQSFERAWYSRAVTMQADWMVARERCAAIRELARRPVAVR